MAMHGYVAYMDKAAHWWKYKFMRGRMTIFMRNEVQELIDSFAYCFKVKVTVFSSDMDEIGVGLKNPGSEYCRLVQNDLKLLYACHAGDRDLCKKASVSKSIVSYRCHAGLVEATLPVRVDGVTIGYIMIGQMRTSLHPSENIVAEWVRHSGDESQLRSSFARLSSFDGEALANMFRLFTALVGFIVSRDYL